MVETSNDHQVAFRKPAKKKALLRKRKNTSSFSSEEAEGLIVEGRPSKVRKYRHRIYHTVRSFLCIKPAPFVGNSYFPPFTSLPDKQAQETIVRKAG